MKRLIFGMGSIVAVMLMTAGAVQGASWTVDGGGGGDFTTISAAITAASPGDTINVNSGTYDEAITINKPINLIGAGAASTIITYTNTASKIEQNVMLGSNTGSDFSMGCLIENFTFYNGGGLTGDNDLIKFRARGVGGQIVIRNNTFDGDGDGSISSPAKAIEEAYGATNFLITENSFTNCQHGMWLNTTYDGTISSNTFNGIKSAAIGLNPDGPYDLTITGNVETAGKYGIIVGDGASDVVITQNQISGNSYSAVLYWDDGDASGVTGTVLINQNNLAGNVGGIVGFTAAVPDSVIDATMNWWGDVTGPSGGAVDPITAAVANGLGDSITLQNVHFDNWLTAPIPEPATMSLLALGGLGALIRRRRRTAK